MSRGHPALRPWCWLFKHDWWDGGLVCNRCGLRAGLHEGDWFATWKRRLRAAGLSPQSAYANPYHASSAVLWIMVARYRLRRLLGRSRSW